MAHFDITKGYKRDYGNRPEEVYTLSLMTAESGLRLTNCVHDMEKFVGIEFGTIKNLAYEYPGIELIYEVGHFKQNFIAYSFDREDMEDFIKTLEPYSMILKMLEGVR